MQKVLVMETETNSLRSTAQGWTYEDADYIDIHKHIGLSLGRHPSDRYPTYDCPMKALADGWKLLVPPSGEFVISSNKTFYTWWFVKD